VVGVGAKRLEPVEVIPRRQLDLLLELRRLCTGFANHPPCALITLTGHRVRLDDISVVLAKLERYEPAAPTAGGE
jgi:hypothetical protein